MGVLDRKPENVDTFVPPEAPLQDGRPVGRSFARKARILLVAATAAVTVGLHVFRHRLYASEPPEILVHPAAVVLSPRASTTDDFDWDAVSRPYLSRVSSNHVYICAYPPPPPARTLHGHQMDNLLRRQSVRATPPSP